MAPIRNSYERRLVTTILAALPSRCGFAVVMFGVACGWAGVARAQVNPLPREVVAIELESGRHSNPTAGYRAVYTTRISVDETRVWIRLRFADAHLDGDSYIQITSVLDGAVQRLHADHLWQWSYSSAYFNGSEVDVTLMAAPRTVGNFFRIEEVVVGLLDPNEEAFTICDGTDDRVASDVAAVGRTIPGGCTATIYNPASCAITAGHCVFINNVFEFNVPLSLANGAIQHPGPEDQYAIDPTSRVGPSGGVGNDWGHFTCFANTETGLLPFEAQQDFIPLATRIPPLPMNIRINGYGVDDGAANQTQQLSLGPVLSTTGSISHRADTTGGSSGSVIVDIATGLVVGIHTHGGCSTSPTSSNSGTLITLQGIQNAVSTCLGIEFDYPDGLVELVHPKDGATLVTNISTSGSEPDPSTVALTVIIDGGPPSTIPMMDLGGGAFTADISPAPCSSQVSYYISLETVDGIPVTDPSGAPANVYVALVGTSMNVVVSEDFEASSGYSVSGDATDGQWNVGVPIGGGDRGDPPTDYDGSGKCYLTDNVDGNSDVDGGTTILTSPLFSLSGLQNPFLSYARWYSNSTGAAPEADVFEVDIFSNQTANWSALETIGPTGPQVSGGWFVPQFRLYDLVSPGDQIRVRFSASDLSSPSVVEAGVDALRIVDIICDSGLLVPASPWGERSSACAVDEDCVNLSTCVANSCYVPKNRFVSVEPNPVNNGVFTARRVSLLIPGGPSAVLGWMAEPMEFEVTGPEPSPQLIARISATPFYADWSTFVPSVVHLGDCHVSPGGEYLIQAIVQGQDEANELSFSAPTTLPTVNSYGDVIGPGSPPTAPDDVRNLADVQMIVFGFQGMQLTPKVWLEMENGTDPDNQPDLLINLADVFRSVLGFQGEDYPYFAPLDCP